MSTIIEHTHAQILGSPPMPSVMWEPTHRPLSMVGEIVRLVIAYTIMVYKVALLDFITHEKIRIEHARNHVEITVCVCGVNQME